MFSRHAKGHSFLLRPILAMVHHSVTLYICPHALQKPAFTSFLHFNDRMGLSHESNLTYAQPLFLLRESNIHFDEKTLEKMRRKERCTMPAFFLRIFMLQRLLGRDIARRILVGSFDAVSRSYVPSPEASFPQAHWHCPD